MQIASVITEQYVAGLAKTQWRCIADARGAAVSASRRTGTDWLVIERAGGGFEIREVRDA